MKTPLTLGGIEPATFRFVAHYPNHCATAVRHDVMCTVDKLCLHKRRNKRIYTQQEIIACLIHLKTFYATVSIFRKSIALFECLQPLHLVLPIRTA